MSRPHEQASRAQAKEKQVPDGTLASRRRLEEQAQQEISKLHEELHKLQAQAKRDARDLRDMSNHAENLDNVVHTLRDDLEKAKNRVAALEKTAAENEAIITQANATAVSRLASNVSREFTDDMIREALKKFFQTDFFSWCADVCADRIEHETAAFYKFLDDGIINGSYGHLKSPEYLRFKVNTPDGSGPLVLLQAALATRLCALYLNDAYFLAQQLPMNSHGRRMLSEFERHLSHVQIGAATDWRVETVACLQKVVPITEDHVLREVDSFVREYGFLLSKDQFNHEARKDLVQLFADFATLALKLWRTKANVQWCDMRGFDGVCFDTGNNAMEVDSSLVSTMGQRLNGRPIGLIIRPAIWSNSMSANGKMEEVIWLKAHAWVSGEEDPMDTMSLI
ncbi:hypothetical protein M440DRAFT_1418042 [Trichoderma longibrachiatum ATCC 18648]|uniref:Uncharacterized protein n=1 Tax=Trichoderma longibrachiatum ATCC 18648 TaxID=983965 RepID=A0A2T4CIG9_TRILO|nr:hypothetical protein M440DRAFT_1418042 [Trichoderma longibrachiatum ATCC 18648]